MKPPDVPEALPSTAASSPARDKARNSGASIWFVGALTPILLAGLLETGGGRQVKIPGLDFILPETCSMRLQFGMDCPGCGLTRGFVHAAHGRFSQAYAVHALSLPLFAFALLQLPLALSYWIGVEHRWLRSATRLNLAVILILAMLMLIRWCLLLASGELFLPG